MKIYTDSKALLDSLASTHQIEQRMLRNSIADLKQKLEVKEVQSYEWLTDEDMIADILTKEKVTKDGLDDILINNRLEIVHKGYNEVVEVDGEFMMRNKKTKDKKNISNDDEDNGSGLFAKYKYLKQRKKCGE